MPGRFPWQRWAGAAAACTLITAAAVPADAVVIDRPQPTTGCGHPSPVEPGVTTTLRPTSGGIDREYAPRLPARYKPHRAYPVVLSFHGHKRTSQYQEKLSGFSHSTRSPSTHKDWSVLTARPHGQVRRTPRPRSTCCSPAISSKVPGTCVWPSTSPNPDSATPTVIDATLVIWQFFRAHPLISSPVKHD